MKIKLHKTYIELIAVKNERYRTESALFHALKKALIKKGFDCIKKCPAKDGHMTSAPWYIRDRKNKWCIIDNNYVIRDAAKHFNEERTLDLKKVETN